MKRTFFPILVFLLTGFAAMAQKSDLMVKSGDKGFYLEHKVAPKESFYSLGRLYNVSPKFLASYNKLDMTKGLLIDQKLRIPLTDTNFIQSGNSGTPVYYKTKEKESLAKISKDNNGVSVTSLRGWNKLGSEDVKEGTKLVIGFLKSKEMPSVTLVPAEVIEKPVEKKEETPIVEEVKPAENKPEIKEVEKPVVKEEQKPVVREEQKPAQANSNGQGFFKTHFEQQVKKTPVSKDATVTSGIFKTTSGLLDGKYYLLIDGVPSGTIVKVINPANNKAVFAKVLGEMSGIRQNEGLNIRISNAAAAALEIGEQDKFIVRINY